MRIHRTPVAGLAAGLALLLVACSNKALPTTAGSGADERPEFTPGSGTTPTPLGTGVTGPVHIQNNTLGHKIVIQSPDSTLVRASLQLFAPGGTSGWHTHAGPVIVMIRSGTLTSYDTDCHAHVFPAGTAFIEAGGKGDVHTAVNEGAEPLEFLAVQLTGVDAPARIDAPQPPNCPH